MKIKLLEFLISILPLSLYGIHLLLSDKTIDGLIVICFTLFCSLSILFFKNSEKE